MAREINKKASLTIRLAFVFILAAALAWSLSFPSLALAVVKVDETELDQGENEVGGGKATLVDSVLDMVDVKASNLYTDESLSMNFNGGNEIERTTVAGSANVDMNFTGDNAVEDITAIENANVTINANGHNSFEEVAAADNSNVAINVAGENDFENIGAFGNANITVRGTTCQKRDIVNLGEGESFTYMRAINGNLTVDHVTVNVKSETASIGSDEGNVRIDTSKIGKGDDNGYVEINAGGTMEIDESVIDIAGTVYSNGKLTIKHSDVKAAKPDSKYGDPSPYRVYSKTGIELIRQKNGEVREGDYNGKKVWYVDTDGNDGSDVDLKADGEPGYYRCGSDTQGAPKTGDTTAMPPLEMLAIASAATALYAGKRRRDERS